MMQILFLLIKRIFLFLYLSFIPSLRSKFISFSRPNMSLDPKGDCPIASGIGYIITYSIFSFLIYCVQLFLFNVHKHALTSISCIFLVFFLWLHRTIFIITVCFIVQGYSILLMLLFMLRKVSQNRKLFTLATLTFLRICMFFHLNTILWCSLSFNHN